MKTIRQALEDRTGSVAEGLAGIALIMIVVASLGIGVSSNMYAVTTIATKAERQALISALVGDEHAVDRWGTPSAPATQEITLPNGNIVPISTWREKTSSSTRLTIAAPTSPNIKLAQCASATDRAESGCIYATRLHANTIDEVSPQIVLRKLAGDSSFEGVGTVHAKVGGPGSLSAGETIASANASGSETWRYLVQASRSSTFNTEVSVSQDGKELAVFPVEASGGSYYGTITTTGAGTVRIEVTVGAAVVDTVYIYRVRSTS